MNEIGKDTTAIVERCDLLATEFDKVEEALSEKCREYSEGKLSQEDFDAVLEVLYYLWEGFDTFVEKYKKILE
jgi:hypothetical protein